MNPSTLQARVVVDELIRGGVRDVVLCPGSRNAPLAFALADADRAGRLRLHVRIDERTAGYLAVGLALSGSPVCIAMTSGTAVANLGPAVIEANYARVPLIVLSANRPYELLGTGANQTMEQFGYFGNQVRATISLGLAEAGTDLAALNAQWRSATCRVLVAAKGSRTANAGPVQFDIPLREPLVPDDEDGAAGPSEYCPEGRPDGRPWTYTPPVTFDQPLDIDLTPDTVVIAGHGAGVQPNLAHLPTVAEPTAPPADNPLHPLALPLVKPRQVIMLGRPTLHRPVSALLADPSVPVYALTTGPRWPDVSGNSQATGTRASTTGQPDPDWITRCAQANARAEHAVRAQLREHHLVTGLHVAAAVADGLHPGDQLVLGASNPVRDAALVGLNSHGIAVRSNRGVAGIDGTVSTAIGAALAHEGGHTVALIGDLTFVHDSSGLLIGPTEPTPRALTIVVSNDNGGGIFELLEQGDPRFSDVSSRIFGTPHDVDVAGLCRAYHVECRQVEATDLGAALNESFEGMRVLEVKADRSSLRSLHAAIRAAIKAGP